MDVLDHLGATGLVPPTVLEETTRPAVTYRHRDSLVIQTAIEHRVLMPLTLTSGELMSTGALSERIGGMHRGECEVLAVAIERSLPAAIFERRAQSVARALGVIRVDVVDLLFGGTSDRDLLEHRLRRFAELVAMRLKDIDQLLELARNRRLP
jgi:predicted nucleic acid-binding protein